MIVDKKQTQNTTQSTEEAASTQEKTAIQVAVETNPMAEAYKAVRDILAELKEDPNDDDSPPLFKTIKFDNGQLSRVKNSKQNEEYAIGFPAVFIHFIDVYYLVGASNIAEGRGEMRIRYVLNTLNNSDDEVELEGLQIYKRIITAIEDNKADFPALVSRFYLSYWDQPESFDDGLQQYWITYEIYFNDYTSYRYKDYIDVYITHPPFTQPSDQNETANPDGLEN